MTEAEAENTGEKPASPEVKAESTPVRKRQSLLSVASETMKHIEAAEKDKTLNVRTDDKKSVACMIASFLTAVVLLVLQVNPQFKQTCIAMALAADLLFGLSILWYVLLRFGVLRTVEPRHALLCWQLMLGAGALFAFYTLNIALAFFTLYMNTPAPAPPITY